MSPIRTSLALALFVTITAAAACSGGKKLAVRVDCETPTPEAAVCTVKQTEGKEEMEACWDFTITCANGEEIKAPHSCQKVKDGGTEKVTIPRDQLANADKCGGNGKPTAKVTGLTINGKKAD